MNESEPNLASKTVFLLAIATVAAGFFGVRSMLTRDVESVRQSDAAAHSQIARDAAVFAQQPPTESAP